MSRFPLLALLTALALGVAALFVLLPGTEGDGGAADRPHAPTASDSSGVARLDSVSTIERPGEAQRFAAGERAPVNAWSGSGETQSLEGRVVDARVHAGISGVSVRVVVDEAIAEFTTGEDGTFSMRWTNGPRAPSLEVTHPEYVDQRRVNLDLGESAVIELERSGSIRGRVVARGGVEAEGASVALWLSAAGRYRGDALAETGVDARGQFTFDDLRPGAYAVAVTADDAKVRFETGVAVQPGQVTDLVLPLAPGPMLSGRVAVRGSTEPVAGARVEVMAELQGAGEDVESLMRDGTETGADGTFRLALGTATADVEIRAPWGAVLREKVALVEGQQREHTFSFPAPAHASGRVVTPNGSGVAHASVALGLAQRASSTDWGRVESAFLDDTLRWVHADADGHFDLGQVPSRERLQLAAVEIPDLVANGASGLAAVQLREGQVENGIEIVVTPKRPLEGRVLSTAGAPVPHAEVWLALRVAKSWSPVDMWTCDAEGRFRFPGAPVGDLRVDARCDGYGRATERLRSSLEQEPEVLEIVLEPTSSIEGVVVDPDGWAVPGARVRARIGEGEEESKRGAEADAYGRFRIDELDDGTWRVGAWASGYRFPDAGEVLVALPGAARLELVLEPEPFLAPATLTGELALKGTGLAVEGLRIEGARRAAVTFEGTRFRVTGLRPGRTRLMAVAPGVEKVAFPEIDLAPGAWVELGRFETRRTSSVAIEVLDGSGKPVRDAQVRLVRKAEKLDPGVLVPKKIDLKRADGRYRAEGVGRYDWRLEVRHKRFAKYVRDVRVNAKRQELRAKLETVAEARARIKASKKAQSRSRDQKANREKGQKKDKKSKGGKGGR